MLLIIAITVFAAVAIGIVTLLRSRHESYPYQVQSYQAYTLAHAGVEFALGYAKENADNFFQNPVSYIPPDGKEFRFGNGKFTLRYIPGCPDTLYSRGTCGMATREVRLTEFGSFVGQSRLYAMPATLTNNTPVGPPPYTYASISFGLCDTSLLQGASTQSKIVQDSLTIAATIDRDGKPVKLWRLGLFVTLNTDYRWIWDARCGTNVSGSFYAATGLPPWDPVAYPVPRAVDLFQPVWNVNGSLDPVLDSQCRPQLVTDLFNSTLPNYANRPRPEVSYPAFDNNATCTGSWGTPVARSHATCWYTTPMVEPWTNPPLTSPPFVSPIVDATIDYGSAVPPNPSALFIIETSSDITPPVTFYVSFLHRPWDPALGGPGSPQPHAFQFTLH
jgi:hypothetical protein